MSMTDEPSDIQNIHYWRGRAVQAEAKANQLAQDLESERQVSARWRRKVRELEIRLERGRAGALNNEQQETHPAAVMPGQEAIRNAA